MKVPFSLVFEYLDSNICNNSKQATELLESLIVPDDDLNEYELDNEYSLGYFLIYQDNFKVYFSRLRSIITIILYNPLKITRLSETCGKLVYSLLSYESFIKELVSELDSTVNDNKEVTIDYYQFQEILSQIKETILVIGNWKNLSNHLLGSKCSIEDKSTIESIHSIGLHTILSVQSILFYLVHYLTQKILANKQLYLILNFEICSIANENLTEDETSFFIQYSYLVVNNLLHLHLSLFKKNVESNDLNTPTTPCKCVAKCWYIVYRLMQTYDTNGYLTRIQQIFWTALSRISNKLRKPDSNLQNCTKISNKIYIQSEANLEYINHFIILFNYEIYSNLRLFHEKANQIQASNYLDQSYNILKNTLKDILDQNQGVGQVFFFKLQAPLNILCQTVITASVVNNSQFSTAGSLSQKIFVDILIMLWESYFCKNLNSLFMFYKSSQNNSKNTLINNITQSNDFKFMLQTTENKICSLREIIDLDEIQISNIYHTFLRYLFLNIKESSSSNGSSNHLTTNTNNAWRAFKGRLYTRLHDNRIVDLDMNGIVNVAYLFYVLLKCFSFSSLSSSQLKFDQLENYFRILNIFLKSKKLTKIEYIVILNDTSTSNSNFCRTSAMKTIFNTKFTLLRLWFQADEYFNSYENSPNNEEIEQMINLEFVGVLNEWIDDSMSLQNKSNVSVDLKQQNNSNQINNYKHFQSISKFLSETFTSVLENIRLFLFKIDETSTSGWSVSINLLTYISCQILNGIKFDVLFKVISRKQLEVIIFKLTELILIYKGLIKKELKSYAFNSKLSTSLTELITKLWNIMIVHQNTASIFSYEIIANFFYELCSLYSSLFYNPSSLIVNSTKQMKTLIEMVEQISFSHMNSVLISSPSYFEDNTPSSIIRLKILNNILVDENLFEICKKNMANFQAKLINFLVFVYLHIERKEINEENRETSEKANLANTELKIFFRLSSEKLLIFNDLNLKFDSNIELFVNDFISRYADRIKHTETLTEKKILLENFSLYFQEFIKLTNCLNLISSHAVLYKLYLVAAQIINKMSMFLHSRGKSDTIFAKILDKMILPFCTTKNNAPKVANTSNANNLNSILISLKDTLHLFLIGISNLNYDYDGYLQRILQTVVANFSMKFQMLQLEDHFLVSTIESSFGQHSTDESNHFRNYILKIIKQAFLYNLNNINSNDLERCLSLLHYILTKTESQKVINQDAEIYFCQILYILGNESNALKSKALTIFNFFIAKLKEVSIDNETQMIYANQIEALLRTYWGQTEPSKIFISLCMVAKQKPDLITYATKKLILQKVEESHSKFRYNMELKNTLFTLFEYLDGEQGKVDLNSFLSQIF